MSVIEYGAVVSLPLRTPSTTNSTLVTPTLSLAVAESVMVPLVPLSLALTAGAVASVLALLALLALLMLKETALDEATLPAASYALATRLWLPLASVLEVCDNDSEQQHVAGRS
ncbi:hypothetical protein GCM10008020_35470 [Massilia psychrophila]|nr:hypothetical protein GCM10008020_35470 [Massilia psychrophila]